MSNSPSGSTSLQRAIGPVQFVALGFGSMVGTAWVALIGHWLLIAAPGGTALGMIAGGLSIALIAAMYAELGSRFPQAGGEVTYINAVFGKTVGFIVGWLLTLACFCALIFEAIALGWIFEILWPPLTMMTVYTSFGESIGVGGLLISLASCAMIAILNYRGAQSLARFQNVLTSLFLAIVLVIILVELWFGSNQNIHPMWQPLGGGSWLAGAAWVFGMAPLLFNSFQSVLQAIEERRQSMSKDAVVRLGIVSVLCALIFYLLILLAATRVMPIGDLAGNPLAPVAALESLPGANILKAVFLLALAASLLKSWNPVFMTTARLIYAQSREGMIPAFFGRVSPTSGTPVNAVIIVAIVNIAGVFIGKGALLPVINTISISVALIYAMTCAAALVMRRRDPAHVGFKVPGGLLVGLYTVLASLSMVIFALIQPEQSERSLLKWGLLGIWTVIGIALYRWRNRRDGVAAAATGEEA